MNEKQLHALAAEFAKTLKTPENLNQFSRMLKKITVEAALNAELTEHSAMKNISPEKAKMHVMATHPRRSSVIDTPRDRDGSVEPQLIKKNQTRITWMNRLLSICEWNGKIVHLMRFTRLFTWICILERLQSGDGRFKAGLSSPNGGSSTRKSHRTFAKMAGKIPSCGEMLGG